MRSSVFCPRDPPIQLPKEKIMNLLRKLQSLFWTAGLVFALLIGSTTPGASAMSLQTRPAGPLNGGQLIPADEAPKGYSLTQAAAATAYFNTGPRTPDTLPQDFPFQILYFNEDLTFTVKPGTMLYVPVITSDNRDSGAWPFPDVSDPAAVSAYYYDPGQLGAEYIRIIVDGKAMDLGPDYAAGVVMPQPRPDDGIHDYTVVAGYLTPLNKGTHTVRIAARFTGAFIALYPDFFPGGVYEFDYPYTVIVK
jgi:hypothetical protein